MGVTSPKLHLMLIRALVKSLFFYSIVKGMKNSLYSCNEGRNKYDDAMMEVMMAH